jgi:hypothetical protein
MIPVVVKNGHGSVCIKISGENRILSPSEMQNNETDHEND